MEYKINIFHILKGGKKEGRKERNNILKSAKLSKVLIQINRSFTTDATCASTHLRTVQAETSGTLTIWIFTFWENTLIGIFLHLQITAEKFHHEIPLTLQACFLPQTIYAVINYFNYLVIGSDTPQCQTKKV